MNAAEVDAELRELLRFEDGGLALDDWYARARVFQEKTLGVFELPESIVHFLIDADVRRKDPRYREMQRAVVQRYLETLRASSS
jgi:hypothetical protein